MNFSDLHEPDHVQDRATSDRLITEASDNFDRQKASTELVQKNYYRIGEVAKYLGVEVHTLRYWQSQFPQLRPRRHKGISSQRYFTLEDVKIAARIRHLLYEQRFTIEGAKKQMEKGGNVEVIGRAV